MTPNRSDLTMEERIEQVLHDFAESLHEYANGRAHGGVYREELDKSATKVERLVLEGKESIVKEAYAYWAGEDEPEVMDYWFRHAIARVEGDLRDITAELGELGESS